jgi:hypothetical protein
MRYLIVSLLLFGCGGKEQPVIDQELLVYADRFEKDVGLKVIGTTVVFGSLPGDKVGVCSIWGGKKKIVISREYWEKISENGREMLMYHEFGHCIAGLGHDEGVDAFAQYCPNSIMYPYAFSYCYSQYKPQYLIDIKQKIVKKYLNK